MFEHLIKNGPYSEATAAGFLRELAAALVFLHSHHIIHADLKPENLMLSSWDLNESKLKVRCGGVRCDAMRCGAGVCRVGAVASRIVGKRLFVPSHHGASDSS